MDSEQGTNNEIETVLKYEILVFNPRIGMSFKRHYHCTMVALRFAHRSPGTEELVRLLSLRASSHRNECGAYGSRVCVIMYIFFK